MGDALAVALLETRGFTSDNFALYHPGGSLGKRLLLTIKDLMRTGSQIPAVHESASIHEALLEMTQKSLGMTSVLNDQQQLAGIYTDGDLRRTLGNNIDLNATPIQDVMTKNCKTIAPDLLAIDALQIMEHHKITSLLVIDHQDNLIGVAHMRDTGCRGLR